MLKKYNSGNNGFEIPIVLLLFKRHEKIVEIINVIEKYKPQKIYLLSDGARNADEEELVKKTRENAESAITWDCVIVKRYLPVNHGVFENIGNGAKWVFEREEMAIFLEDDNLPDISFLEYAKTLLYKFKEVKNILWICGTNYLTEYKPEGGESYMFTKHLLPCGWASWSSEFLMYYDGLLETYNEQNNKKFLDSFTNKRLAKQQLIHVEQTRKSILRGQKPSSWDHQLEYSLRVNDLFGISPSSNLIENIGVDEHSIHGGTSNKNVMVHRFTQMKNLSLDFPLTHPNKILIDRKYEKKISLIREYPFSIKLKLRILWSVRRLFKIPSDVRTSEYFFTKKKK